MNKNDQLARLRMFRSWMSKVEKERKTHHLRELEMWLKSFDRYFSVTNLPLSDEETREVTLRDYSEELKIVNDVIFRISQVCTLILSEEEISYSSFAKYVENSLKQTYFTDSYIRKTLRHQRPDRNLSLLMEALLDVRTMNQELCKLSKIPYLCFVSVGRIVERELRKGIFLDFFLEKKFSPLFDKISNPHIIRIVRSIEIPAYKRSLAAIFLEFYRLIRYLSYIPVQIQDAHALKRSLLIFSLVHAESRLLIQYIEDEFLKKEHPDAHFVSLMEGIAYSLSMEWKKVMQRELLGTAALQQYELIFTKIQNSQGILLNSIQQIVFSIAQYFDPALEGNALFADYVTKLEQSLKLRTDLRELQDYVKVFGKEGQLAQISALIKKIESFKSRTMKYLMYKDWIEFDNFYHEIHACKTAGSLQFSVHRFDAFLLTLIKEVNKRSILQKHQD